MAIKFIQEKNGGYAAINENAKAIGRIVTMADFITEEPPDREQLELEKRKAAFEKKWNNKKD